MIPYGRQSIDEDDIQAVIEALRSDYITTGPKVKEFEQAIANFVGGEYAVSVNSGTAALHCAMHALEIKPGDEVIIPPITFAATANCILYQGAKPVFVDVEPDSLLLDPEKIEAKITPQTKAIIAVDYAGQPCDYNALRKITEKYDIALVADACHSLGGTYKNQKVGSLADLTVFSFHPVKNITTGEGGMVVTDNSAFTNRMFQLRNHGINIDHHKRMEIGQWFYEINDLGFNYRISDIQCALGISQLTKLNRWIKRRNKIAQNYNKLFDKIDGISHLKVHKDRLSAYHLYVIKIDPGQFGQSRNSIFRKLMEAGISSQVHYIPVHLHPYYKKMLGTKSGDCPVAERAFEQILSLPIFPGLTDDQIISVVTAITNR